MQINAVCIVAKCMRFTYALLYAFAYPNSLKQTGSARYWYGSQAVKHASSCVCYSEGGHF